MDPSQSAFNSNVAITNWGKGSNRILMEEKLLRFSTQIAQKSIDFPLRIASFLPIPSVISLLVIIALEPTVLFEIRSKVSAEKKSFY
ncbi:hypothetical protein EGR_04108 [Echinococcus granulosus]|uniref:Uncharacterized protein n=1 Tax=Echinococcus granulosus TaxID=6210 RepID=W6UHW1_ECHGR|nr:hypothetical protein EGR_04108 [Echinococcus granulosus]EUB61075.1 hypothetical protein EGR_04108 [Echinococcus granulosus]